MVNLRQVTNQLLNAMQLTVLGVNLLCTSYATLSREIPWNIPRWYFLGIHTSLSGMALKIYWPTQSMDIHAAQDRKVGCSTVEYTMDLLALFSMAWYKYTCYNFGEWMNGKKSLYDTCTCVWFRFFFPRSNSNSFKYCLILIYIKVKTAVKWLRKAKYSKLETNCNLHCKLFLFF